MTDRQTKAVAEAIDRVAAFAEDHAAVDDIEDDGCAFAIALANPMQCACAAIAASDAKYVPMLATVLRVLSKRPIATWYGNEAGGYYAGWDDAEYAVKQALAVLPEEYKE